MLNLRIHKYKNISYYYSECQDWLPVCFEAKSWAKTKTLLYLRCQMSFLLPSLCNTVHLLSRISIISRCFLLSRASSGAYWTVWPAHFVGGVTADIQLFPKEDFPLLLNTRPNAWSYAKPLSTCSRGSCSYKAHFHTQGNSMASWPLAQSALYSCCVHCMDEEWGSRTL